MTSFAPYIQLSQSEVAVQIERLVQAIEQHDTPAFRFRQTRSGEEQVEETRLSRYFDHIQQMFDLFDDCHSYRYSEHLQVFQDACCDIGLERSPVGLVCLNEQESAYLDSHRTMNAVVERIRELTCEPHYRRRKSDRSYEVGQLQRRVSKYVDAVLDRYSRTVVVRVNLYYRTEAQARLRAEHVFDHLDRLIDARERNPIFEHETGYICSVEQGARRGYHIHAAFFFNGAEVRGDVYKAQKIGELWERITQGQGCYDSCNHDKDAYGDRCAIGIILRSDDDVRPHVHRAMHYLVKGEQNLRMKPVGARAVRMGICR
ncbi:YagK/YfjJ domain-containing protein [Pseudomonas sp. Q1-7]|uniref:YagK/YfjJ domain-containing protein n=1 Tax=Pseudomonas sp. Q1-7 TaxID=3020843 RepID=UPI002301D5EC|nr:inovirus-type Gp2 protein [Pseudomonas sp. Q1-7]